MTYNRIKKISNFQSSAIAGLCLLLMICLLTQCSDSNEPSVGPNPEPTESTLSELRQNMATHYADVYIAPAFDSLETKSVDFERSAAVFFSLYDVSSLVAFRQDTKDLWLSWQKSAIYQFGPVETSGLRSTINIYPSDIDKIESNIENGSWDLETVSNLNAGGLPAIDYLINNSELTDQEIIDRIMDNSDRHRYLVNLVASIATKISLVNNKWITENHISDFKSGSSNGTDVGSALSILVNSIDLHIQRYLRDGKIAIPAGVRSAGVPRPQAVEGLYGGYSRDLLETSIQAYIDLFNSDGNSTTSIEDYLDAIDQSQIADDILQALQTSLTLTRSLEQNFVTQIENDNDQLIELFMSLQEAITIIKSDMSSVMGITITNQDNDGD